MIISILVIAILGTLLHFIYEISKHNKVAALFAAVNESTWEHIKIALTPTFLYGLYDGFIYGMNGNYFSAKLISLLIIIIVIPLLFYTYQLFTKKSYLVIDIIIFYIAIILAQVSFSYVINLEEVTFFIKYISCIGIFIVFGFYMVSTLLPSKNFLFKDPISNKYGLKGHTH